jgi:hypothetical protein
VLGIDKIEKEHDALSAEASRIEDKRLRFAEQPTAMPTYRTPMVTGSDLEALIAVTPAATFEEAACKAKLVALAEREDWHWRRGHPARELARGLAADLERLSRSV